MNPGEVGEVQGITFDELGNLEGGSAVVLPFLGEEQFHNATSFERLLNLPPQEDHGERFASPSGAKAVDFVLKGGREEPEAEQAQKGTPPGDRLALMQQQINQLISERGHYGRNVVGPMRQELEALRAENAALKNGEGREQAHNASVNPADYVHDLLGEDADPNDPESRRLARLGINILQATERGTNALLGRVEKQIASLGANLEVTRAQAMTSIPENMMEQARERYPELRDLPEARQYSFVKRLLDDAKSAGNPAPNRGAAPSSRRVNPDLIVEGSTSSAGGEDSLRGATDGTFSRFRELSDWQKPPADRRGGKAQENVFLSMLQGGHFSG